MSIAKTTITIMADESLMERVQNHAKSIGENLTEFYTRAIISQIENDGDYEVRDTIIEGKEDAENF